MRERFPEIDGVRAAAALAVVMIHVSSGYTQYAWGLPLNQLSRFAVPLFILLSGFGSASPAALASPPLSRLGRRMLRLLPPYLLWSAAYLALDAALGAPHPRPLLDVLTGSAYVHLYFLFVLLQLETLCALFSRIAARHPRTTLAVSAAVTLGAQAAMCLDATGALRLPVLPFSYTRLFPPYLFFYAVGFVLRLGYAKRRQASLPRLALAFALWLGSLALVLSIAQSEALRPKSLRPDLALYTLCAFFLLRQSFLLLPSQIARRATAWISSLSFGLYLSHPLVLRLVHVSGVLDGRRMLVCVPVLFFAGTIGGLLLARLLSALPFGIYFGGRPRAGK